MHRIDYPTAAGEIRILDMKARCSCGGSRFEGCEGALSADSRLTCRCCRQTRSYGALLDQIGERAVRRAAESLERLKRAARARSVAATPQSRNELDADQLPIAGSR